MSIHRYIPKKLKDLWLQRLAIQNRARMNLYWTEEEYSTCMQEAHRLSGLINRYNIEYIHMCLHAFAHILRGVDE